MKHFLALALLLIVFLAPAQSKGTKANAAAPVKVAYVNVEQVIAQLPESKQLDQKLKETQEKLRNDLMSKQQDFDKLYKFYQERGQTLVDSTRQKVENQLQAIDADIQQFNADAQNTFDNTRKLYLTPVYLKLGRIIQQVATENGYSMVIPTAINGNPFILHADQQLNVSDLVLKKYLEQAK